MDDLSNRDLSQAPDEALTPGERAELKRRLDGFVDVLCKRVIDGCRPGPGAKGLTEPDPGGEIGKD